MNKSNKHFETHFEKTITIKRVLPVDDESVISMETEFELEEKNFSRCWLNLMQIETQRNTWLILKASYHFRQRYQREKLWSWLPAFHKEQLQRGTLHFSHDSA